MGIKELIKGNVLFKNSKFKEYKNDFKVLVEKGQSPEVLFIGCSDSRVVPDLIVDSKPGDMFILRNVGNFVPPYKSGIDFHGSAAAIEYAVSVLNVKHIIVCGHSHCGACKSLYSEIEDNVGLVHVKNWLKLGESAKKEVLSSKEFKLLSPEEILRKTERVSIVYQLRNLLSYPIVKKRVEDGSLKIDGWYYKIESGEIECYNKEFGNFETLH